MSLYTKPIADITLQDVEAFCREGIQENATLDYKEAFPNHLENTIAAMANTIGGVSGANSWSSCKWQLVQTAAMSLPFDRLSHSAPSS